MGEVLKRTKNGRFIGWSIRYYDATGKRCVRATRQPTHAAAKQMLRQIEARIARDEAGIAEPAPAPLLTVAELCARFLAAAHPRAKSAEAYRKAAGYSLRAILPLVGPIPLARLRRRDLEEARDRLSRRLKPNSVRAALRPLGAALTWAVKQELIAQSPMAKLDLPRREQSTEHLRADEVSQLLVEAERQARETGLAAWSRYVAVSLALRLGLRRGEVFGLRWQDVDLKKKRLTVARSYTGLPKSGRPRTLPIPSALASVLTEWQPLCPATAQGLVCPIGSRGRQGLAKLLEDAGCQPLARGWHSLRHSFASCFVGQGGSVLILKELLGHASLEMSLVYSHVAPAALVHELERMKF